MLIVQDRQHRHVYLKQAKSMTAIGLLTELATAGATIRRLPGDQIEVGGELPPGLAERLAEAKPQLLDVLPDPVDAMRREWAGAVQQANELLDSEWVGTAEQRRELNEIESRFSIAVDAGDLQAVSVASREYIALAQRFRLWEDAMRWPDVVPFHPLCESCGFDSSTNSRLCETCEQHRRADAERIRHKSRDCTSTDSWQHTFGKRYCEKCWPCTDEAMKMKETGESGMD